jgi:hypothetical protein
MTFVVVLRYSADDWNLRKPLQQCSLRIERRGDVLGTNNDMIHYVKPVADSSRYFAVRVMDEKSGREATLGLGFREREEAEDFTQCLVNFRNAIARERLDRGANMAAAKVQ